LIGRFTEGTYFGDTKTTVRKFLSFFFLTLDKIGCDFSEKKIQRWDKGYQLNLCLWDIAGQDRNANLTRVLLEW
jgi:hypothetical protein